MTDDLLARFGRAPSRAGVFLDFDGVLADIVATPDRAIIRPGTAAVLEQLRPLIGRLAIVSGRPVSYLTEMVPPDVDIVGLYRLEWRLAAGAVWAAGGGGWGPGGRLARP